MHNSGQSCLLCNTPPRCANHRPSQWTVHCHTASALPALRSSRASASGHGLAMRLWHAASTLRPSFFTCLGLWPWPGYAAVSLSLGPPPFDPHVPRPLGSGLGLAMRPCPLSHSLGRPLFACHVPRPLALAWLGGCVTQPRRSALRPSATLLLQLFLDHSSTTFASAST